MRPLFIVRPKACVVLRVDRYRMVNDFAVYPILDRWAADWYALPASAKRSEYTTWFWTEAEAEKYRRARRSDLLRRAINRGKAEIAAYDLELAGLEA